MSLPGAPHSWHPTNVNLFRRLRISPFARALEAYGLPRCSMAGATLCVGLPPHPQYKRLAVERIPEAPTSIAFFEGPLQAGLVRALASSPEVTTLKHLAVATSHDFKPTEIRYDMSEAVTALRGARLPALERLALGDMEMLFNGHRLFGTVGAIDHVFDIAPGLRELNLHGHFVLQRLPRHAALIELTVEVEDIGIVHAPLDQETVSHLLLADFPALETCHLDLFDDDAEFLYSVPDAFFAPTSFPALSQFSINTLNSQAADRVAEWQAARNLA
jgi:hypothetical protein